MTWIDHKPNPGEMQQPQGQESQVQDPLEDVMLDTWQTVADEVIRQQEEVHVDHEKHVVDHPIQQQQQQNQDIEDEEEPMEPPNKKRKKATTSLIFDPSKDTLHADIWETAKKDQQNFQALAKVTDIRPERHGKHQASKQDVPIDKRHENDDVPGATEVPEDITERVEEMFSPSFDWLLFAQHACGQTERKPGKHQAYEHNVSIYGRHQAGSDDTEVPEESTEHVKAMFSPAFDWLLFAQSACGQTERQHERLSAV